MKAIRFGPPHREMVGFYHPPSQSMPQHPAVLICNPFGPEAIRSHRMLRLFADRLARTGCPVLRFDYFGTGDSPGEDEAASLIGWAGDIGTAHRELVSRSGKTSVAWLGVRLGGSLCALAAQSMRVPLRNLVLWDPIDDGFAYLRFLANAPAEEFDINKPIQSLGFALPSGFKNELRTFNLRTVTDTLASSNLRVSRYDSDTDAGWTSDKTMNTGAIPAEVLRTIESKLLESA